LQFTAELDSGLELLSVTGSNVKEYQVVREAETTRVTVVLAGRVGPASTVHFEAHARIPLEGRWSVPAIRPRGAIWTGGTTTIVLDSLKVLQDCEERAGRRLPSQGTENDTSTVLNFEAASPASVADLVFRHPRTDASCLVQGRLIVGSSAPELECQLSGLMQDNSATALEIDLPPTWVVNRVQWGRKDESLSWHSAVQADGSTRLCVLVSRTEAGAVSGPLLIGATSTAGGGRGPLLLPRVRPAHVAVADETWVAMVDDSIRLRPLSARGLVWLIPDRSAGTSKQPSETGLRTELAWRWNAENAEARIDREEIVQEPRVEIRYHARIAEDAAHLVLEGDVLFDPGTRPPSSLPLWIGETGSDLKDWSFYAGTAETVPTALDDLARARWGFPISGLAVSVPNRREEKGRSRIHFVARRPWTSRGSIPLILAPKRFLPRGTVLIEAPHRLRARLQSTGLRRLDTGVAERLSSSWRQEDPVGSPGRQPPPGSLPIAHALSYTDPSGKLEMTTEELVPIRLSGIVRDAYLATVLRATGPWLNRLRLLVHSELIRELRFALPANTALVRAQVDGLDVVPARVEERLVLALSSGGPNQRLTMVELDYEVNGPVLSQGTIVRPAIPSFELPCLSFCWQLLTPRGWELDRQPPGFAISDSWPAPEWPLATLGLPVVHWPGEQLRTRTASEETLHRLDHVLSRTSTEETTFAEWFTRWDAGSVPLIVDRLALGAAGLGPRSRCSPVRLDPAGQSISLRTLQQYGLALVPLDGALVITSQAEAAKFDLHRSWRSMAGESLLWGGDHTDRFQTVTRWRGEITPREALSARAGEVLRSPAGWITWRFTAPAWPDDSASVEFRTAGSGIVFAWAAAFLTVLGLLRWRPTSRWSVLVPIALLALAVMVHLWLGDRHAYWSAGVFSGALFLLLFRLGQQVVLRRSLPQLGRTVDPLARMTRRLARITPILLALILPLPEQAQARRDADMPIPILLPYEGNFDPGQKPSRVVLRESDFQSLTQLSMARPATEPPVIVLTDAKHRLSWSGQSDVVLESDLTLLKTSREPATWSVPVGGARDISATLNEKAVPVFIEAEGGQAAVSIQGTGTFELRFRRTSNTTKDGAIEALKFPVNPMPSARLTVDGKSLPAGLQPVRARGRVTIDDDHRLVANLGPADQVEIRSGVPEAAVRNAGAGVDGVVLWDIEPAGDLLRARFAPRGARGLSQIGFQMDPGLILRSILIPGYVSGSWSGNDAEPVWTAKIDPPLSEGAIIELDLWRPLAADKLSGKEGPAVGGAVAPSVRRLPQIEPVQAERYSGVLGVRRPGHWTGRLEPVMGTEPLSDESFVKAWGQLPDDRLTLSGTTRLGRGDRPQLHTGPSPARIRPRGKLDLRIDRGRVGVEFEAEVGDLGEPVHQLEVTIPSELVVLKVDSPGLSDWSRKAPRQLLIRYDRTPVRSRQRLRIGGWIPVIQDLLSSVTTPLRIATPWLEISGTEVSSHTLSIASITPVDLIDARGLTLIPSGALASSGGADSRLIQSFRVDDARRLGTLQWRPPTPQVTVHVVSQLTIHPDSAEWVAVLQYDVQGGPLDSIHLKLSTAWALKAQYELAGNTFHLRSDSLGAVTIWAIKPDRPIWGSQRIVVRSALPLRPGQEVEHPEITPLGQGRAATYLGLVNATGTAITTAGSSGLQEVTPSGLFRASEFSHLPDVETHVYRVGGDSLVGETWSLKAQVPPPADQAQGPGEESARVVSADLDVAIRPDRSLRGRAIYETLARSGRLLVVELPPTCNLVWSTVDQSPAAPLRSTDGRLHIPVGEQGPHRVSVFWNKPADSVPSSPEWSFAIPRAGLDRVDTLLTVYHAGDATLDPTQGELEVSTADRLDLERADRIARQITEFTSQMDRGSARDRQRITSLLVAHELALRSAERSLRWTARLGDQSRRQRLDRDLETIHSSREVVLDAVRASALDEESQRADYALGLAADLPETTAGSPAEAPDVDAIRLLGKPTFLAGFTPGLSDEPTTLSGSIKPRGVVITEPELYARSSLMLGLLITLGLFAASRSGPGPWSLFITAALLGLLEFVGGPAIVVAGATLAAAGWLTRPAILPSEPPDSRLASSPPVLGSSLTE
jgi:hypothetical protein